MRTLVSPPYMNQHRYNTRARVLSCVILRVKSSGITSFVYQGVCHWNKLPLEIKQCPSKDTFLNIKLSVFYIVVYLCRKPVYMYVLNANDLVFFLHISSDDSNKMYYLPCYFQRFLF